MTKKRIITVVLTAVMSMSTATSVFAMDKQIVDIKYRHVTSPGGGYYGEVYSKQGVADGWYSEDGMWFYMENGVASSKARKLNGVMNYFTQDGVWLDTSTQSYSDYVNLLASMRQAKENKNISFLVPGERTMSSQSYLYKLMDDYSETYLYPTDNLEETCFKVKIPNLVLDISSKYYNTEDKIRSVLNKLNIPEGASDEQKVRLIHDFIVSNFDYDSSDFRSSAGSVADAIASGGKLVCSGYARLFMQLCNKYGLDCDPIYGKAYGGPHVWNKVKVNGEWKYIDVTWDDNTSSNRWYLISETQMNSDHTPGFLGSHN